MSEPARRARLKALLGNWADDRPAPILHPGTQASGAGYLHEEFHLDFGTGARVPASFVRPARPGRHPAILYCHAHGNRYDIGRRELVEGRAALLAPPYAEALTQAGFAALCLEMPCFGARAGETESALAKALLWRGETLFGLMLRELAGGLDHLASRDDVDPAKIGAFGISMGATLAFWLAALDARIRAVAHLCCLADLATLIAGGGHDLHGIYMTVPGLTREFRTGEIAGLVAPRAQFVGLGTEDPLTPPAAITAARHDIERAYRASGQPERFTLHLSEATGHTETPAMREAVLAFFASELVPSCRAAEGGVAARSADGEVP